LPIRISAQGDKTPTQANDPHALGNDDEFQTTQAGANSLAKNAGTEDLISEGLRLGLIDSEAAAYLKSVTDNAREQLKTGPVLLGEYHGLPATSLIVEQLIKERAIKRVLFELPPLESLVSNFWWNPIQLTPERTSQIAEYFSSVSSADPNDVYHRYATRRVSMIIDGTITATAKAKLVKYVMDAGVNFDFIDGGRKPKTDVSAEHALRNNYMSDKIRSDSRFKEPGVIGVFGAEHLRTRAVNGVVYPALQELSGVSPLRVFDVSPAFSDGQTGKVYYPSSVATGQVDLATPMSRYFPYKIVQSSDTSASGATSASVVAEKYWRHVVVNGAGDSANAAIEQIKKKHPSTSIVFNSSDDGVPKYSSGAAVYGSVGETKVHIFNGEGPRLIDAQHVLKLISKKLGTLGSDTRVKEMALVDGIFKEVVPNKIDRRILINANHGDPAADYAVAQLAAKHPSTTTVVIPTADGGAQVVSGSIEGGGRNAKFEVVGHGADGKIGALGPEQIASTVARLSAATGASVEKLTLVGCESLCTKGGLVDEVRHLLETKEDIYTRVKGYPTPIIIDGNGHKLPVSADTAGALGKHDSQSADNTRDNQEKPNLIWDAQRSGKISYQAAEYLEHVKNKASYQLQLGPVFFGEVHGSPFATLLFRQLNSENRLKRVLLEDAPLSKRYKAARDPAVVQTLMYKGFSSVDDYFSNFDVLEKDTKFFRSMQKDISQEALVVEHKNSGKLREAIINSGLKFDCIDCGRMGPGYAPDDPEEVTVRNLSMANAINSDPKFQLPGVIGIFGAEHLRKFPTHFGVAGPAIQEMVNLPENRTYDMSPLFTDYSTHEQFFRWTGLSDARPKEAPMSIGKPYKKLAGGSGEAIKTTKYPNHVVLNAAGESAHPTIERLKAKYPSTTIVFNAHQGGELDYVDGASTDFGREKLTKVFLFAPTEPQLPDKYRWLTLAAIKTNRAPTYMNLKEYHETADGEFEFRPPSTLAKPVLFKRPL